MEIKKETFVVYCCSLYTKYQAAYDQNNEINQKLNQIIDQNVAIADNDSCLNLSEKSKVDCINDTTKLTDRVAQLTEYNPISTLIKRCEAILQKQNENKKIAEQTIELATNFSKKAQANIHEAQANIDKFKTETDNDIKIYTDKVIIDSISKLTKAINLNDCAIKQFTNAIILHDNIISKIKDTISKIEELLQSAKEKSKSQVVAINQVITDYVKDKANCIIDIANKESDTTKNYIDLTDKISEILNKKPADITK